MIILIAYFFCVLYVSLIAVFFVGWRKTEKVQVINLNESLPLVPKISVVIPFRNEAENLPKLLYALQNQTFSHFEIVFVDDHSTDNSQEIIENFRHKLQTCLCVMNATGTGKKNALREGIEKSSGELIICTDADCIPHKNWIESIAAFYAENQADIILAPVVMLDDKSAFGQMQALEFMSLQASTAGAACAKMPIMCNGANMAFPRQTWQRHSTNLKDEKLSGDDMFLMMSVKRAKGNIAYLKSEKAAVFTFPCRTFTEFFNQRKRWVSKSTGYTDFFVILTAFAVFGISAMVLASVVWGILTGKWLLFAFVFLVKLLADRIFLYDYAKFAKSLRLLRWLFPLSFVYPFYVAATAIMGVFGQFEWKGRQE
jgi:cellulose synthase/poly-beta-1,6-N-acetylglucosamine synthase-like glycosyltransferase